MRLMRELKFEHLGMGAMIAYFPKNYRHDIEPSNDNYVRFWQNHYNQKWNIFIQYEGKTYIQEQSTIYDALDASNDWWFHAQRGMLDEK